MLSAHTTCAVIVLVCLPEVDEPDDQDEYQDNANNDEEDVKEEIELTMTEEERQELEMMKQMGLPVQFYMGDRSKVKKNTRFI